MQEHGAGPRLKSERAAVNESRGQQRCAASEISSGFLAGLVLKFLVLILLLCVTRYCLYLYLCVGERLKKRAAAINTHKSREMMMLKNAWAALWYGVVRGSRECSVMRNNTTSNRLTSTGK